MVFMVFRLVGWFSGCMGGRKVGEADPCGDILFDHVVHSVTEPVPKSLVLVRFAGLAGQQAQGIASLDTEY
jgi:hypothetical protein